MACPQEPRNGWAKYPVFSNEYGWRVSLPQLEKFPFLTLGRYLEQEYLGVIGNSDNQITSMYVYNLLHDEDAKKLFLELGDEWWWETNRQMPINVALKDRWTVFRPTLKTFITSDFEILQGPCVSLDTVMVKRIKRRQIQLVRKQDPTPPAA